MPKDIFSPLPIVSVSEEQTQSVELKEQPRFQSLEEMHRWALFNLGNPLKGKDGRTYASRSSDGKYVSRFVSQFSKIIYDNVEPKIKPVIMALHQRGYLTFGSCQGHPDDKEERNRWFGVCFASSEARQNFIEFFKSTQLPLSYWTQVATPSTHKERGLRLRLSYKQETEKGFAADLHNEHELTQYWNLMFQRNYSEYFPLAIGICCDLSGEKNWLKELKFYYHRRNLEPITLKVAKAAESLPDYVDL